MGANRLRKRRAARVAAGRKRERIGRGKRGHGPYEAIAMPCRGWRLPTGRRSALCTVNARRHAQIFRDPVDHPGSGRWSGMVATQRPSRTSRRVTSLGGGTFRRIVSVRNWVSRWSVMSSAATPSAYPTGLPLSMSLCRAVSAPGAADPSANDSKLPSSASVYRTDAARRRPGRSSRTAPSAGRRARRRPSRAPSAATSSNARIGERKASAGGDRGLCHADHETASWC